MRKICVIPLLLCSPLVLCSSVLFASTAAPGNAEQRTETWTAARCAQLRQSQNPHPDTQQLLSRHCSTTHSSAGHNAAIMPVQLDMQLPAPATATPVPATPQRVQHHSTLEWLGSSMLLVLLGFWLWMGRR